MKKLLLSAVCVAALASPALAGGGWNNDADGAKIEQGMDITQIGVNNGMVALQFGTTEDFEMEDGVLEDLETGLDQGDMRFQNVNWVIGEGEIGDTLNINDDVESGAMIANGDISIEEEMEIEVGDITVAWDNAKVATKGGEIEEESDVEISDITVAWDNAQVATKGGEVSNVTAGEDAIVVPIEIDDINIGVPPGP